MIYKDILFKLYFKNMNLVLINLLKKTPKKQKLKSQVCGNTMKNVHFN